MRKNSTRAAFPGTRGDPRTRLSATLPLLTLTTG